MQRRRGRPVPHGGLRLHLLIAEVLGAPSVIPLVADVRMRVNELLDSVPPARRTSHSDEQHRAIVGAILEHPATP